MLQVGRAFTYLCCSLDTLHYWITSLNFAYIVSDLRLLIRGQIVLKNTSLIELYVIKKAVKEIYPQRLISLSANR